MKFKQEVLRSFAYGCLNCDLGDLRDGLQLQENDGFLCRGSYFVGCKGGSRRHSSLACAPEQSHPEGLYFPTYL